MLCFLPLKVSGGGGGGRFRHQDAFMKRVCAKCDG